MSNSYQAAGKTIQCPHCGHDQFASRQILLNTRGATFFNFDWLNKGATVLTCQQCSRLEWFAEPPAETGSDSRPPSRRSFFVRPGPGGT